MEALPLTRRRLHTLGLALILAPAMGIVVPAVAQEKAVAPEVNPPGDIPDNQQFVIFEVAQGAALKVPEGTVKSRLRLALGKMRVLLGGLNG